MCVIVKVTSMLMNAKENIDLPGSEVIVLFLLVNLVLKIDVENIFIEINTI